MRRIALWLVLSLCSVASASAVTPVFINEIHYDNTGTDAGEIVEIAGPAGTNLTGWSIVLYNGAGGAVYDTDALSGTIPNQQNGFGTVFLSYPSNGIQNGSPDGIALVNGTTVVQFLSYEGTFTAVGGPANGMASTDIGVSQNGTEPLGSSLQLQGTGSTYEDFTWRTTSIPNTQGLVNTGQTFTGTATVTVSMNDVTVTEGDSGTVTAQFVATFSQPTGQAGNIVISTQDNTATVANNDYQPRTLSTSFAAGATAVPFAVNVVGDTAIEPNETFFVNVTSVTGDVTIGDGQGVGTITNDDFAPAVFDVSISQIYGGGGNSGATLTNDFIELFNRGNTSVNVTGWSVQYNAPTNATAWQVTPLSGSISPGGYYLVREAAGTGGTVPLPAPDATGSIAMGAGAGKVALRSNTTAIVGACAADGTIIDLVGYGAANCFEGSGPTPPLSNTTAALRKRGGCLDFNNNAFDFIVGGPNPRNSATATRSCEFVAAAINQIQGPGLQSPFTNMDVITNGIVTARKVNGFFVQSRDADVDVDPNTSEGLFVFTGSSPVVAAGDAVTVKGTAVEFFNLTQLESTLVGDVTVSSMGNPLPSFTTLTSTILNPAGTVAQLERFEGMRVHADSLTSVAPTNEFGEVFTVLTGVPRPMREPGIEISLPVPPDPTTGVVDCCIPRWDENPERITIDMDGLAGSTATAATSNVTFTNITGPLDFTFSNYKILPEVAPAVTLNMSAVPVPLPAAGEFTVAGFNIENFANNDTQRRKAALAVRNVMRSPDIIGHVEIGSLAALEALATQVNNDAVAAGEPNPMYEARLIPAPQGGTQHLGFLVKTSRIQINSVTQERATDTFINPVNGNTELLHDRPPLVLHATVEPSGLNPRPVIVVVNHTRSFIDVELLSGEGVRVRAKRTKQAEAVAELLQQLQSGDPTTPVIAVGDYNAFQFSDGFTDPISILKGMPTPDEQIVVDASPDLVNPNFVNLIDTLPAEERYSFVFDGTPQALDHVLVNTVAQSFVQRFAIARNNADFPEGPLFAADVTRPERNSDHDMPVAYFRFPPPAADLVVTKTGPVSAMSGSSVTYQVTVKNNGPNNAPNVTLTDASAQSISGPSGWTCTATSCTTASLAKDVTATFTVTVVVPCGTVDGSPLLNTASAASSVVADPNMANNSSTWPLTVSNPAPVISGLAVDTPVLKSNNHKMVDIALSYSVNDNCGPVTVAVAIASNEPVDGTGDGDTSPDWEIVDLTHVRVRAERAGTGDGRIYTITVTATDSAGGSSSQSVTVTVPKKL